jgi:hypothetical protein
MSSVADYIIARENTHAERKRPRYAVTAFNVLFETEH